MFVIPSQAVRHPHGGGWETLVAQCGRILAAPRGVSQILWPPGKRQMASVGHRMAEQGGPLMISLSFTSFPRNPQQPVVTSQGEKSQVFVDFEEVGLLWASHVVSFTDVARGCQLCQCFRIQAF